jgi:hypothetical protein
MNGKPGSPSSDTNASPRDTDESIKKQQQTRQPADEEIGDYDDPDMIQVDGGDNSFVAGEGEEKSAAKKKPTA